ncbi:hypothetical protein, partial [Mogibacterium kristiansenii]|uniref:hypothetical protein n=1 Tax=Mogibacterium kristiansenii TaxID=2606708 RepID=UPI0019815519
TIHFHQMKKTAQLFCKSNFLSGFANLKSSAAITKAELTFSIQEWKKRRNSVNEFWRNSVEGPVERQKKSTAKKKFTLFERK